MSIHFHKLKIKEIRKETADCVSVLLEVPEDLAEIFSFSQGQNITLRTFLNTEDVRRSYSICAAPYEKELRVAVKEVEHGLFSGFINRGLKAGDEIDVLPPTGKFFTQLAPDHKKKYLAFAAGSGITPVISIIKSTLRTEPQAQFTLVYSNRNRQSIMFLEELEALKNKWVDRFTLIHVLTREATDIPLQSGRLTVSKLKDLAQVIDYRRMDELFICGPEQMIFTIEGFLKDQGIDRKKIHFELFNTVSPKNAVTQEEVNQQGGTSIITIRVDGRSLDLELAYDGSCILDAALKQGADLPYACKGGVCASCRAKLISGKVNMDMNWALEPEEVADGYILTCQSHPTTPAVVIDFDSR